MNRIPERLSRGAYQLAGSAPRAFRQRLRRPVAVHWHEFYELVFVASGSGHHDINGTRHVLAPGTAVLLTPTDLHAVAPAEGATLTCYTVIFDAVAVDALVSLLPPARERRALVAPDLMECAADIVQLCEESRWQRPGRRVLMAAILHGTLVRLVRQGSEVGEDADSSRPVLGAGLRSAIRHVDHHFREPLTLAQVSALAYLSPKHFSSRFHQATGQSFRAYLQDRRLTHARALLATTDLGVAEICRAAGFNDLSHFGRSYGRRYGEPPSAVRRS